MANTKAFVGEYKGSPVLSIKKVDENGEPLEASYPVISFGKVKAKAILEHVEDIEKFVKENE